MASLVEAALAPCGPGLPAVASCVPAAVEPAEPGGSSEAADGDTGGWRPGVARVRRRAARSRRWGQDLVGLLAGRTSWYC